MHMTWETARIYWRISAAWLITACGLYVLSTIALISPDLLAANPALNYGRLAVACRIAIFNGFLITALFATGYSFLPSMRGNPGVFRWVRNTLPWVGASLVFLAIIVVLAGYGSGRAFADMPIGLFIAFWVFLIAVAFDFGFRAVHDTNVRNVPAAGLLLPAVLLPSLTFIFAMPDWWGSGMFAVLRTETAIRIMFLCFIFAAIATVCSAGESTETPGKINRGPFLIGATMVALFVPFTGIYQLFDMPLSPAIKAWGAFSQFMSTSGLILLIVSVFPVSSSHCPSLLIRFGLGAILVASLLTAFLIFPPVYLEFHSTFAEEGVHILWIGGLVSIFIAGVIAASPYLAGRSIKSLGSVRMGTALLITGIVLIVLFQFAQGIGQIASLKVSAENLIVSDVFRWLNSGVLAGGLLTLAGALLLGFIIMDLFWIKRHKMNPQINRGEKQTQEVISLEGEDK